MSRTQGRHRLSRRTKIATGGLALAMAVGGIVVATTTGNTGQASADEVDPALFVDILKVAPNQFDPRPVSGAATGTFTVDCGRNENGHFNPDNFIAQPGVRNGAQHLHDYVGNLSTNADSNNKSLVKAGTTCRNGDKSAYYWPVVRIDTGEEEAKNEPAKAPDGDRAQADQEAKTVQVACPDVASKLPDVPDQAMAEVESNLDQLDGQTDEANQRVASTQGQGGADFVRNAILTPLKDRRAAILERIAIAIGRFTQKPRDLGGLAPCAPKPGKDPGTGATPPPSTTAGGALPGQDENNELPENDGVIQRPQKVQLTFRGSPTGKVVAMPKFLRVLYGDAKVSTNGPANARASWTCSGFENRVTDKYPICPQNSKVKRIHTFPSCWDGQNIDSANHRTHIVFPDQAGWCPKGFKAVPQLQITLTYDIPHDIQVKKQYKVDSFPQEHHNPLSDHDDFANVMSQRIMSGLVNCVNRGRTCRA
ncbi:MULTISPECIES: DUF1996 domain-containing protein [unclassified Amycolatopsis]|uniref:DUF1996 domain-containing protein n=1 Tax=unclassified Amycolatopsis TaxID=2618356 RepID=UPI002E13D302|nr:MULTISPECIES: DUF1996 domain-containing protein [unclassified Amycolatopsis]WSJ80673.1 DUF1996 domain-containing protein [Amycolatopsis sp. NBC_01307]WSK75889.1 DUF1996 domain-containing protein [Amycolatopsis sp. NBC_01286]